jgi:hypothetical protein
LIVRTAIAAVNSAHHQDIGQKSMSQVQPDSAKIAFASSSVMMSIGGGTAEGRMSTP